MRILLKMVGILVTLVFILLAIGIGQMDRVVKKTVETVASELTGTDVTLDGVDISLPDSRGELTNLKVGNPDGFATLSAFSLDHIEVRLDMNSLTTNTVVVKSVLVKAPQITYEYSRQGSNLGMLQENIARSAGRMRSVFDAGNEPVDGVREVNFIIENLLVSKGVMNYSNPLLGESTIDLLLPPIHLSGIGAKSGGISVAEMISLILNEINNHAIRTVASSDLVNHAGDQVGKIISGSAERFQVFDRLQTE